MEREPLTPNGDGSVTETGNSEPTKQERSERDNNEETMYDAGDGSDEGAASDGGA